MSDPQPGDADRSALSQFREGDLNALAAAFRLYGARVYRLAAAMLGDRDDAEDASQEIFLRAFRQARKFHGSSEFYTWLYRLAVRYCLNSIRGRRRRRDRETSGRSFAPPSSGVSQLDRLADAEDRQALADGVRALPPNYRTCLVLREIEGLSYAQIGDLLGIPTGTVMSRLARARRLLRARFGGQESRFAPGNAAPPFGVQFAEDR